MEEALDTFRMNMKYYRAKKNFSQAQLAESCSCSNGMIGLMEAGKAKPSFDMIVSLAAALEVHPADLFLRNASSLQRELRSQLESQLVADIHSVLERNFS